MIRFSEKTNSQIQQDVLNELNWDQSLIATDLSVTVNDGLVVLRGSVPHYLDKATAEHAAQRVSGVRAVADEIEVKFLEPNQRTDEEIARTALNGLDWNYSVPKGIQVIVERGWITLTGEVEWDYQRRAAQNVAGRLKGVLAVSNHITIKQKSQPNDIKNLIEEALKRSAQTEARDIEVLVNGDQVTLKGHVESNSEIEDAKTAAWNAPGVMSVISQLKISH